MIRFALAAVLAVVVVGGVPDQIPATQQAFKEKFSREALASLSKLHAESKQMQLADRCDLFEAKLRELASAAGEQPASWSELRDSTIEYLAARRLPFGNLQPALVVLRQCREFQLEHESKPAGKREVIASPQERHQQAQPGLSPMEAAHEEFKRVKENVKDFGQDIYGPNARQAAGGAELGPGASFAQPPASVLPSQAPKSEQTPSSEEIARERLMNHYGRFWQEQAKDSRARRQERERNPNQDQQQQQQPASVDPEPLRRLVSQLESEQSMVKQLRDQLAAAELEMSRMVFRLNELEKETSGLLERSLQQESAHGSKLAELDANYQFSLIKQAELSKQLEEANRRLVEMAARSSAELEKARVSVEDKAKKEEKRKRKKQREEAKEAEKREKEEEKEKKEKEKKEKKREKDDGRLLSLEQASRKLFEQMAASQESQQNRCQKYFMLAKQAPEDRTKGLVRTLAELALPELVDESALGSNFRELLGNMQHSLEEQLKLGASNDKSKRVSRMLEDLKLCLNPSAAQQVPVVGQPVKPKFRFVPKPTGSEPAPPTLVPADFEFDPNGPGGNFRLDVEGAGGPRPSGARQVPVIDLRRGGGAGGLGPQEVPVVDMRRGSQAPGAPQPNNNRWQYPARQQSPSVASAVAVAHAAAGPATREHFGDDGDDYDHYPLFGPYQNYAPFKMRPAEGEQPAPQPQQHLANLYRGYQNMGPRVGSRFSA